MHAKSSSEDRAHKLCVCRKPDTDSASDVANSGGDGKLWRRRQALWVGSKPCRRCKTLKVAASFGSGRKLWRRW